jgi:hypothetical protein
MSEQAYPYAPRYLGSDADGNDILTYIPGVTTEHPAQRSEDAYAAGSHMLKRLQLNYGISADPPLPQHSECVSSASRRTAEGVEGNASQNGRIRPDN